MNEKISFVELSNEWLEVKKFSVKYSTRIKYKNIINVYLKELFYIEDITEIDESNCRDYFEKLISNYLLSKSSIKIIRYVLRSILNYGKDVYDIKDINFSYFKISENKLPICVLSDEEKDKMVNYCLSNTSYTTVAIYISLYTGMRIGEVCGLKWEDIDFKNQTISVVRTVQRIKDEDSKNSKTSKMIFEPKTQSSKRVIVMTDFLAEFLLAYKAESNPKSSKTFIISNSLEIPEPRNVQRNFKKICGLLDIKATFHILRHTFATNCVKYGMDVKILSELLGHSSITTTMNLYVHPTLDYKKEQINKIPK
ncbi:site-specific integrase [Thomasclavelia sp.]|uniref:tyrosine-type recombinase/integrase n=1 Tax=Thomasclavelia sp. TaxID=3025757 RepID=UPI0025F09498|nr:site-specific integrase [Thomasclavelia sp.]